VDALDLQSAGYSLGRRMLPDRRERPTPVVSRHLVFGRRRRNRRRTDPQGRYYVDWVDGRYAWALLATVAFIFFDTFSTIHILNRGGLEMNPLMAWIHDQGKTWFILAKLIPSLIVFPLLAVHRFFTVGRFGTLFLLFAYGWVFMIHLAVLANIHV